MEKGTKANREQNNEASHTFLFPLAKLQPYTPLLLKHNSRDSYSEEVRPYNFSYSLCFIPGTESGYIASADAILTGATKNAVKSFCLFQRICDYGHIHWVILHNLLIF